MLWWAVRISLDLSGKSVPGPIKEKRVLLYQAPAQLKTFALTGKDRVTQLAPLSSELDTWGIEIPARLGPYERMTLVRLCVALEQLGGIPTEHDLGPEFEEDLEAVRGRPWPGAISELGLVI